MEASTPLDLEALSDDQLTQLLGALDTLEAEIDSASEQLEESLIEATEAYATEVDAAVSAADTSLHARAQGDDAAATQATRDALSM